MKSHHLSLSLPVLACLLASCSGTRPCGDAHPYLANRARPPLQAPAGVTLPKPDPAYLVPGASTKAPATPEGTATAPCFVVPPSVLTKEDMSRSAKPAPPAKAAPAAATKVPAASTRAKPPVSPAPAVSTRPNVAAGGPLE